MKTEPEIGLSQTTKCNDGLSFDDEFSNGRLRLLYCFTIPCMHVRIPNIVSVGIVPISDPIPKPNPIPNPIPKTSYDVSG